MEVALATGRQVGPVELGIVHPIFGTKWLSVTAIPQSPRATAGRQGVVAIFEDVTERRRVEEHLRISEARMQRFVDANVLGIISVDESGITDANDAFFHSVGYSRDDFERGAIDWREMTPPDWQPASEQAMHEIRTLGACTPFEKEYVRKDGTRVPVVVGAAAVDRLPLRWICFVLDLSEQKRAQQEIARQAGLLDQAYDATFTWDWGGGITYWNRGAQRLYGFSVEEATGRTSHELLRTEHQGSREAFLAELERHGSVEQTVVHYHRDGRRMIVETRHVLVRDTATPYVLEVNRDVTSRTEIEDERRAFIDTLTHDLKNPLGAIKVNAQLAERRVQAAGEIDRANLTRSIGNVLTSVARMEEMIGQLLDTAHLRDGQPLELKRAPCDLVEILHTAVENARQLTARRVITLDTDLVSLWGRWDRSRLERVFSNLLENAIKYSGDGSEIAVQLTSEAGDAVVTVRDHGIGIPADDLDSIFDRYRRGRNVSSLTSGLGIGLFGVKHIVEQHDGTISVESTEGNGSTFTVRLPIDPILDS